MLRMYRFSTRLKMIIRLQRSVRGWLAQKKQALQRCVDLWTQEEMKTATFVSRCAMPSLWISRAAGTGVDRGAVEG